MGFWHAQDLAFVDGEEAARSEVLHSVVKTHN